jgi:hypothetical protein
LYKNFDAARESKITKNQQLDAFEQALTEPLDKPGTWIIGSKATELRARAATLTLFRAALNQYRKNGDSNFSYPLWHIVFGGYKDTLRDASIRDNTCFLVIDNVAINSTSDKVEKIRDLIAMYPNIPKVVIVSGANPIQYSQEVLHVSISGLLYFGEKVESYV